MPPKVSLPQPKRYTELYPWMAPIIRINRALRRLDEHDVEVDRRLDGIDRRAARRQPRDPL